VLRAAAEQGIAAEEGEILPDDLFSADEAFITSSIREVMPVVAADGHTIGNGAPGPLTKGLHAGYLRLVAEATGAGV
jgi:branched-subunit amino acid aminotransferase/4-amino-4-deoxychorismate lyase